VGERERTHRAYCAIYILLLRAHLARVRLARVLPHLDSHKCSRTHQVYVVSCAHRCRLAPTSAAVASSPERGQKRRFVELCAKRKYSFTDYNYLRECQKCRTLDKSKFE